MGDIYCGVSGVRSPVASIHVGIDGVVRTVRGVFTGVDGVRRTIWETAPGPPFPEFGEAAIVLDTWTDIEEGTPVYKLRKTYTETIDGVTILHWEGIIEGEADNTDEWWYVPELDIIAFPVSLYYGSYYAEVYQYTIRSGD